MHLSALLLDDYCGVTGISFSRALREDGMSCATIIGWMDTPSSGQSDQSSLRLACPQVITGRESPRECPRETIGYACSARSALLQSARESNISSTFLSLPRRENLGTTQHTARAAAFSGPCGACPPGLRVFFPLVPHCFRVRAPRHQLPLRHDPSPYPAAQQ